MSDVKQGAHWLLEKVGSSRIFTVEDLNEEQKAIGKTAEDFLEKEVRPLWEELEDEEKKLELEPILLKKAGELGLLMIDIPEEYGGLGLDKTSSMVVSEKVAPIQSFAVTLMAHTGIGTLPIVHFGTKEQKEKYLPKLATGEWIAAYALTETGYGSDALHAKTKAVLSPDGKYYILNGEKQFITNSGFADVFIVYAQVDGEKFTAFIVERDFGVKTGAEENKMGIRGSSTRSLILEDVKVPVENVLGEIGKGHKSALNILDVGRFKLGIAALGVSKRVIKVAAEYANQRKQFGVPISVFGMIRRKFADMATLTYVLESMAYRLSGLYDSSLAQYEKGTEEYTKQAAKVFEDYQIEASIMKVFGSEVQGIVVDHGVQIHGGYGFIEEYEVARQYRDARISRIFEGTNEINRLLLPTALLRRYQRGELDLMSPVQDTFKELQGDVTKSPESGPLGYEITATELAKKAFFLAAGAAVQKFGGELRNQQFIMENLADIMIGIFGMDSAVARALQYIEKNGEDKSFMPVAMTKVYVYETFQDIIAKARQVLVDTAQGNENEIKNYLDMVNKLWWYWPLDITSTKNKIAEVIIGREDYSLV